MFINKRRLNQIIKTVLVENFVPTSALDTQFIPAGTLEDILEIDGVGEFQEELAMYCELLENGDEPYFIMEHAVYKFIMRSMFDLASDRGIYQRDFINWYDKSEWNNVKIERTAQAVNSGIAGDNYVKWSMR